MNKKQFLTELEEALRENGISVDIVNNNVAYYDSYISGRISKGDLEEDIISDLGSGRVIAKTIIDAEKKGMKSTQYDSYDVESKFSSDSNSYNKNDSTGSGWTNRIKSFFGRFFKKDNKNTRRNNDDHNSDGFGNYDGNYYNRELSFESPFEFFKYLFMNMTTKNKVKLILGIVVVIALVVLFSVFAFQIFIFSLPYILIAGLIFMILGIFFRR